MFIDNAKVMAKGQVTIPKDVREALGLKNGDRVTFIVNGNDVRMLNSATYAMYTFQQELSFVAENSDLKSEEDVNNYISELRPSLSQR